MCSKKYRALIVDDEEIPRRMLKFALEKADFVCDTAADGNEALEKLGQNAFDLVVTDLRMPRKHGHALAVDLLSWKDRPAIAIHTSVVEPRLAKDLMTRGVDDIVFKPTDYAAFAAKMSVLVERRSAHRTRSSQALPDSSETTGQHARKSEPTPGQSPPARIALGDELSSVLEVLPLSPHAVSVYELTLKADSENWQIAEHIKREPSLTAELLRLGNSSHYHPSGGEITDLTQIVQRIGRRRVGELALAASACAGLKERELPCIDVELAWRRSVAAGVAAQLLADECCHSDCGGLVLGAVMHLLGRIGLCAAYPREYRAMFDLVSQTGQPLVEIERSVFESSQSEVMARLLQHWNIPVEIAWPLSQIDVPYVELAKLETHRRRQVELVKLAVFIGWLAAGKWEPWDLVEVPIRSVIDRLGVNSVRQIAEATREELDRLCSPSSWAKDAPPSELTHVGYARAANRGFDFVAELLPALGLTPVYSEVEAQQLTIMNCLGASAVDARPTQNPNRTIFLCDSSNETAFASQGQTLILPTAYARFAAACRPGKEGRAVNT